jgi:hypothetical protein
MVVCHGSSTALVMLSTVPEVAWRNLLLDDIPRPPSIIIRPERKEATTPAPIPVRKRRFKAEPRSSRASCKHWAQECTNGRSLADVIRRLGILPNPIAILARNMF